MIRPVILAAACAAASPALAQRPTGTLVVNNMTDSSATLIDAASGRTVATLRTGEGPHEVAISHDGRWALVSNYGVRGKPGGSLTVIDMASARVARTIPFGSLQRPHGSAFLAGDTLAVVTAEAAAAIAVIDIRAGANLGSNTLAVLSAAGRDSARLIPVGR